ncbi:MAG: VanW family protein [Lachnospiraceae bacterium]|nr:VanW family protein [Lachnospiraceae bacterium]
MRNKKFFTGIAIMLYVMIGLVAGDNKALAAEPISHTIPEGISIGNLEVGGLTKEEAKAKIDALFEEQNAKTILFQTDDATGSLTKEVSFRSFGLYWANPDVVDKLDNFGRVGNVIKRYKELKDISNDKLEYEIEIGINREGVLDVLKSELSGLERQPVNAGISLPGKGADFVISKEQTGLEILYDDMALSLSDYLENEWILGEDVVFEIMTNVLAPSVTEDACRLVGKKPMAVFSTYYGFSTTERGVNIENAAAKLKGLVIYPNEEFSMIKSVTPFSEENGYRKAGSYFHGRLTESVGGGVCQVSSTLYNAVLLAELLVTERNNHGLTVDYVQLSADAAIAESSNMDFRFKNNTDAPVLIYAYTKDDVLNIELYGHDVRPANRKIEYVHEILEKEEPGENVVEEDPTLPYGTTKVDQYAHTGYKAELYKNVYVDGKLVEHSKVNESDYKAAPKYIRIGTGEAAAKN